MEDDLNFLENGRQPKNFGKWKTTKNIWKTDNDQNILGNGRRPQLKRNDNINFEVNGSWLS
jgi:hypothetical protein